MKKTVLIIEDDPDILETIELILSDMNIHVMSAPEALEASEVYALAPDLIILDHWLHKKLGGDLCLALKTDPHTKKIPIIMMSADLNIGNVARYSLADAYLAKPFDIDKMIGLTQQYLDNVKV
ncbi:MAG: two-component system response regulator [Sphingobacteriales bacterium]